MRRNTASLSYEVVDKPGLRGEMKETLDRDTSVDDVRIYGMRAEVLSGCKTGMENDYDFCCITAQRADRRRG